MDQLKPYLSALKQHYFWIVLGIVVITSTVVWYMAVGELDQKFTADKQKNESAFMQVSPLLGHHIETPLLDEVGELHKKRGRMSQFPSKH